VDRANDVFDAYLRFDQVAVGAKRFTARSLIFTGKSGHHDYFDRFSLCRRAQNVEHIKAADFWHHNIADDKLWPLFDCHRERFFTVSGGNYVVSLS
jgi:hypothetical protein